MSRLNNGIEYGIMAAYAEGLNILRHANVGTQARVSDAKIVVVMGVAGSGKTTMGMMVADAMHCAFLEGDSLHSAANVEKMSHVRSWSRSWPSCADQPTPTWQAQRTDGRATHDQWSSM
jgi:6-phosphogluconate dehydrogenase (decarboxylating)